VNSVVDSLDLVGASRDSRPGGSVSCSVLFWSSASYDSYDSYESSLCSLVLPRSVGAHY